MFYFRIRILHFYFRKPKEDHESHHVILISLFQLFTCDLENVHAKILTNLRSRIGSSCIKNIQTVYTVTNNTKHGNTSITKADRNTRNKRAIQRGASQPQRRPTFNDCLKVKKEECQNAQYRVIKTIRVSMSVAQILMELIPNLKIIHLVRDARAITNSRLHERVFKLTKDTSAHSKGLCNQIYNDISVGQTLKHLYAERITTVSYEHLAERPNEVAKSIFNFLGVQYDKNIDEWLHKSTHAQKDNGFYGTLRTNSSNVASHWRKELSFDKVEIIQKNCEQVLQSLGYISFKTVKELRSLNISARVTPLIDGFM